MMGPGMFNGFEMLGKMFIALLIFCAVLTPFAVWKIIELLAGLFHHLHWVWQ